MGAFKKLLTACGIPPEGVGILYEGHTVASIKGIDQKLLNAMYSLGHQKFEAEKFEDARNMMRYLCVHDHRNTDYLAALGACEFRMNNFPAAIAILELALEGNENDAQAMLNLGLSLIKNKQRKRAKEVIQKAEALASGDKALTREWKLAKRILEGSGKNKNKNENKNKGDQ